MANGNTATDTTTTPETAQDYFGYEPTASAEQSTPDKVDYQSEVNRLLKEIKVGEDGKFDFPAGTPAWAKVAISNEKKFRDTQGGYTQAKQDNKVLQAEIDVLRGRLAGHSVLSDEQANELETLSISNPDEYFAKRTQYENEATSNLNTELDEAKNKTTEEVEIQRRESYVEQFNTGRKIAITQELIANEVPAKFLNQLKANEVTFEEFLVNVAEFVDTPKVQGKKDDTTQVTNLSDVAGGTQPSAEKRYDNLAEDYAKIVF